MAFCNNCGKKIAEGAEFCHSCGKKIDIRIATPEIRSVGKRDGNHTVNPNRALYIGLVVLAVFIVLYFAIPKSASADVYCGDGICQSSESCSTCSPDCGQCASQNTQPATNYCGDGKCSSSESCSTCSSDCGQCSKVTSYSAAIDKVTTRQDVVQKWETVAKNRNCASRYLDIDNAVYFTARVTVSQNLIDCSRWNNFEDITKVTDSQNKDVNDKMRNCDKSLIEIYNKALRGYDSSSQGIKLAETCENCDDFYAIYLGCIDADVDINKVNNQDTPNPSGIYIYTSSEVSAFAVVDAKTGAVYW